jgi:hypothetical protein
MMVVKHAACMNGLTVFCLEAGFILHMMAKLEEYEYQKQGWQKVLIITILALFREILK